MIKLPKQINIYWDRVKYSVQIFYVRKPHLWGCGRFVPIDKIKGPHIIQINRNQNTQGKVITLIHECLHFLFYITGIAKWKTFKRIEERVIGIIDGKLTQVFYAIMQAVLEGEKRDKR